MNLKDQTLVEWFLRREPKDFSLLKTDYVARYSSLARFLETDVLPLVATGAALQDKIFLNDHGVNHIATVIKRASDLVAFNKCKLTPYEVYMLLAAIQVHDIGNILGRKGHETRIKDLQGQLDSLLGENSVEKRQIRLIAQAHGGARNGNKDTIRLIPEEPSLGQSLRTRFLAALLRFADELADDIQRISQFVLQNVPLPLESQLPHRYSASLQSVMIDTKGAAVRLYFELTKQDAELEFTKDGKTVYLIDEILARTLKMHQERSYCMRFLRAGDIHIDSIDAKIKIFRASNSDEELETIGYRLEEHGYPMHPHEGIYEICPELNSWKNGKRLTGEQLKLELREEQK